MRFGELPQVQAAGDGGTRTRTQVVIIHATDNTASAQAEAGYATSRPDQTSAHFYVDDGAVVQALDTDHIAYGALWHGNQISVQLELCGRSDALSDATMRQAAPIVARVCQLYGLPPVKVGPAEIAAGVRGVCGHADITAAFPQDGGDHTDPGPHFDWPTFISYVQGGGGDVTASASDIITYEVRPWTAGTLQAVQRIEPAVAALQKTVDALSAVVAALAAHGTSIDTAAVLDAVAKLSAQESATVAELSREIDALRAKLAAAAQAGADQLGT